MNEEFYKQREQMRGQINMKDLIIKDQKEIISELCKAVEQLHNAINEINSQRSDNPNPLEYWVFIGDCDKTTALEMPLGAILEMLCDWTAMSLKNGNKPSDWFFSNRFKMKLHEKTVETINLWLPIFDVAYMQMKG